jgi:hypothetical protein
MYRKPVKNPTALFWSMVSRGDGCWEWTGPLSRGYGVFGCNGKHVKAHRYAWEDANDAPVPPGVHVLHDCDNPRCVRPDHLHLGTHGDNMREMIARRRRVPTAEKNNAHKLSASDVVEIRRAYGSGEANSTQLGQKYGVAAAYVLRVVKRKAWAYVA